ncbi:hybrid sensor histidine kinase/response regulator [Myxococcaceae bacterium GXIMD 01537]
MAASPSVILNVDANAARRATSTRALQRAGFTVLEAASGAEALARVEGSTDVVVLAAGLPGLDGREVCQRIKQAPATRDVLVALQGPGAEGADAPLGASLEPEMLVAQVTTLLRLRRAEREVRALTDEMARQRRMQSGGPEAAELFIGLVGHELRNPLNAICLSAQQLARRELPQVEESLNRRILSSVKRMERTIQLLVDFARARRGVLSVERAPEDLFAVCQRSVDARRASHPEAHIEVETLGDGRGAWDGVRLGQVMEHLLAHARWKGGAEAPVRVRVDGRGAEVLLSVHCEGPPIPPEELPSVFDAACTGARGGLDGELGLFLTAHLARAHGGGVVVESSAEAGTTLTVRLPR